MIRATISFGLPDKLKQIMYSDDKDLKTLSTQYVIMLSVKKELEDRLRSTDELITHKLKEIKNIL